MKEADNARIIREHLVVQISPTHWRPKTVEELRRDGIYSRIGQLRPEHGLFRERRDQLCPTAASEAADLEAARRIEEHLRRKGDA